MVTSAVFFSFTNGSNKLEHLFLANFSSLVQCLKVSPVTYIRQRTCEVLHLGRLQPYSHTLQQAEKACQLQTLLLLGTLVSPPQSNIWGQGSFIPEQPSLAHKYQARVEVIGSGKHSSLLRYSNNYCRKKFYGTMACTIKVL